MPHKLNIWILTAKFPNKIQPWLTDSIAQLPKNNIRVKILSPVQGDDDRSTIIQKYNLIDQTEIIDNIGLKKIQRILLNFISPKLILKSIIGVFRYKTLGSTFKGWSSNLVARLNLAPYLANAKIDLIHSHSEPAGHMMLPIIRSQNVPFIVTFHGLQPSGVNRLPQRMREEYLSYASLIFVNTEYSKKSYILLGADAEKIRVLPQGIDLGKFRFKAKSYQKNGVINILTVGRLSKEKGQRYAIEAIANLTEQGYNIVYTIIGQGPDLKELQRLAIELNIKNKVKFILGLPSDEIVKEYQKADIFILPSIKDPTGQLDETQGVVIQEAQACGVIVVATNTGGIPEGICEGKTGFLVNDKSFLEIVDVVSSIIQTPERWGEWQNNARQAVESKYNIDVIGQKLLTYYNELI